MNLMSRFDQLKEPWRFLVFFIPAAMMIMGVNSQTFWIHLSSVIGLLAIVAWRIAYFWLPSKREQAAAKEE